MRNKDINTLLSWKLTPEQIIDFDYSYSRQGNIYAGDTQYSNGNLSPGDLVSSLYGDETNKPDVSPVLGINAQRHLGLGTV